MVSTRGPKFKFSEGERVLCYEPDPTKAKVLYDSKVLEVKVSKDQRGRKAIEFLIHFQGWNSSWDRCVTEDFVLKDTDENRQLQKDLAHKAQLQLCSNYRRGAYLYRKDKIKRRPKLSDRISDTIERQKGRRRVSTSVSATSTSNASNASGTSASAGTDHDSSSQDEEDDEDIVGNGDEDGSAWGQPSSEESSGVEDEGASDDITEESIPLSITPGLKQLLEHDYNLITRHNKLVRLPAEPNVVTILEGYVKHCAVNQLCNSHTAAATKNGHGHRYSYKYLHNNKPRDLDTICRNLNICKEVADGLRVYFDFTLSQLLLYAQERSQHEDFSNSFQQISPVTVKKEPQSGEEGSSPHEGVKSEIDRNHENRDGDRDRGRNLRLSPAARNSISADDFTLSPGETTRKRSLRSSHRSTTENTHTATSSNGVPVIDTVNSHGHMSSMTSNSSQSSVASPLAPHTPSQHSSNNASADVTSPRSNAVLSQVMTWHLVPPSLLTDNPTTPSLVYGATHLARLFVRLPELLSTGAMPNKKLKVLTSHLELFMGYLEEHTEWFADHNYRINMNPTPSS